MRSLREVEVLLLLKNMIVLKISNNSTLTGCFWPPCLRAVALAATALWGPAGRKGVIEDKLETTKSPPLTHINKFPFIFYTLFSKISNYEISGNQNFDSS